MSEQTILAAAKLALRVSTDAFDAEINDLIEAAELDMELAGVEYGTVDDALMRRAVITYVRANFGQPDDYERLKASYDEQKAQLSMATGYTEWSVDNGSVGCSCSN